MAVWSRKPPLTFAKAPLLVIVGTVMATILWGRRNKRTKWNIYITPYHTIMLVRAFLSQTAIAIVAL